MHRIHEREGGWSKPLALVLVLAVACGIAGPLSYRPVIESWNIRQLSSPDEARRLAAVRRLGEWRCVRAVPQLLDALREEPRESFSRGFMFPTHSAGSANFVTFTPIAYAIYQVGPDATHLVEAALRRGWDEYNASASWDGTSITMTDYLAEPQHLNILNRILRAWERNDEVHVRSY